MGLKRAMMIGIDGMDPQIVQRLVDMGRLPNFKRAIAQGTATKGLDMLGVFPTVTPPNWVSLATGNWPRTHGVTCFHNHTLGLPLDMFEENWDSRRVESEYVWEAFARDGKRSIMLNYCQAWPPRVESDQTIMIDGTGVIPFMRSNADYQKLVYLEAGDFQIEEIPHAVKKTSSDCVVMADQHQEGAIEQKGEKLDALGEDFPITQPAHVLDANNDFTREAKLLKAADQMKSPLQEPKNWSFELPEGAKEAVIVLNDSLMRRYVLLTASDGKTYDTISIYANRRSEQPIGTAKADGWSDWIYDQYSVNDELHKVAYKIRVLELAEDGSKCTFYVSHALDLENDRYFYPHALAKDFYEEVGPMLAFASYDRYNELADRVVLESFDQMYEWHQDATRYLCKRYDDWQLFYVHLHAIDLINHWFLEFTLPEKSPNWERYLECVYTMYEITDKYVGMLLDEFADEDTSVFLTSDHAAVPNSPGTANPGIGNLSGIAPNVMEELGYCKTYTEPDSPMPKIDWTQTRAINQRLTFIYINLKGRDPHGIVDPADYENLVQQIISDLYNYRDPKTGERIVSFCMTREEMEIVGTGGEHAGDIFFQLRPTFTVDEHGNCPSPCTNEGYSMKNLCIMFGGAFKEGEVLARPVRLVDVVPTICHICGASMPKNVEGGVIYQALKEF